ncbi:TIGR02646 family protein [Desulfobulbus sp. US4]|nr:TIGR02646 family protein [Desulfobulbus sp. US4]
MKHIKKETSEPENFTRWKKRHKEAIWKDLSKASENGNLKSELREKLIAEQLGMCCYCEAIISLDECHIEHLKPKGNSIYQKEMFSYGNLLASCNRKESCGQKKGKWYSPEMVSPLDENCEKRLTYTLDGNIIPWDKKDTLAIETIEQLGLNCSKLKDRRRSIIMVLDNGGNGLEAVYLKTIAKGILNREKVWPDGFYTVLLFLAELYEIPLPQ